MRRLLVTGGAGFIGCNFVHHWIREHAGDSVVVLDALTYAGNLSSLEPVKEQSRYHFIHGTISNTGLVESILRSEQVDTIVHFAAESHVDRSIVGPDAFIDTNILGTHSLLKAAGKVWIEEKSVARHRFHHVSTDEVYGSLGPDDPAFTEASAYAPTSPYAASKASSDHLVRAYHHTYGLDVTISNCSNNYGPYHFPEKLIPLMIVNMLEGRPLPIYGDGTNVRDWLHVSDHCSAIDRVIQFGRCGDVYNVGARSECENLKLVLILCSLVDEAFDSDSSLRSRFPRAPAARGESAASLISYVKDRPGHDRRYAIDCRKIETELNFVARVPLRAGLQQTLDWYCANERWWRSVMDGSYRQWIELNYHERRELKS